MGTKFRKYPRYVKLKKILRTNIAEESIASLQHLKKLKVLKIYAKLVQGN